MRRPPNPPAVYAIADAEALAPASLVQGVREMALAGIEWIQLRAKRLADDEFYRQAAECCRLLAGSEVELWIDDRVDLAALLPVRGVHLGQQDLPPAAARRVLGANVWIGRSTHDLEQLEEASADPEVDLVALGPVFPTTGKADPDPVVGLDILRRARGLTGKPLIAIGGIDERNLPQVLATGADGAAMIGAVCGGDVGERCRRLLRGPESSA